MDVIQHHVMWQCVCDRDDFGAMRGLGLLKQSLSLSNQPTVFIDSIDYRTIRFSHYHPNPSLRLTKGK